MIGQHVALTSDSMMAGEETHVSSAPTMLFLSIVIGATILVLAWLIRLSRSQTSNTAEKQSEYYADFCVLSDIYPLRRYPRCRRVAEEDLHAAEISEDIFLNPHRLPGPRDHRHSDTKKRENGEERRRRRSKTKAKTRAKWWHVRPAMARTSCIPRTAGNSASLTLPGMLCPMFHPVFSLIQLELTVKWPKE